MPLLEFTPTNPRVYPDILALLKSQLIILERPDHKQSAGGPWQSSSIFLDSPGCSDPDSVWWHLCAECLLIYFVPIEHRFGPVPCRHIPLNEAGESVESIRQTGNEDKLKEAVKAWLMSNIKRLEEMIAAERTV